jgi:transposase
MRVVGMDVHVRNSFLCVTDADGHLVGRGRVGNSLGEISQFLGSLPGSDQPLRVVLESTTNSRAIQRMMLEYGTGAGVQVQAQVLDARKLRVIAESVSKCDKLDAAVLNELARSNLKLPACYVPDDEVFALREHLRARSDLVRMRTMLKNRIHAILHRRGILNPVKDLFTKDGRRWLSEMKLDEAGRQILDGYLSTLDQLQGTIDESTSGLAKLSRTQRWCKAVGLLRTMPGIGPITSLTILAELGDINRFASRAGLSNYAGIVPVVRTSNQKGFSGHITRRGPAHLRSVLVEAAWTAIGRVPQYAAIYNRIAAKKAKQIAVVAVARRILEDAWTMLKRDEVFRLMTVTSETLASNVTDVRISDSAAAGVDPVSAVTVPNAG